MSECDTVKTALELGTTVPTEQNIAPMVLDRPVVVEGKYDKIKLSSIISSTVITTEGFAIFNSREKLALIRRLAKKNGIIVLTDSDGAGGVIRSHITSALPRDKVTHLYIPRIKGKERRKTSPSKAGVLGVEGIEAAKLRELLAPFAVGTAQPEAVKKPVTKADFYADGLSGVGGAEKMRDALAERFSLPPGMTPNALLSAINVIATRDEYAAAVAAIKSENKGNTD
ncbi:MAG: DUF4093 domain-containing protein [Eubacteriales bacterium]|jgi:ribonuclease M5